MPLRDYYHRHTRSIFWEMHQIVPFGNHPVFRYLLGWLIPPKVSFLKATTPGPLREVYKNKHVDQDMLIPMRNLGECMDVFHKEWEIYPLWICPTRILKTSVRGLTNPLPDDDLFVDVGAYGTPPSATPEGGNTFDVAQSHRTVEAFVRRVNGFQALYAITYQTEEELRTMFDHSVWDKLRVKFNCQEAFPTIYGKVSKEVRY
eukprot:TRINITY_DN91346_c0_g1_i2.p1 TRINITY_DN91346_c0_g1~~TRINITY_DN91346_c0_g1_i2.p1  ORF type:complete len:221 (-),score=24.63 TRINITY_DN91346_c0_g1_i2:81-689(-)